MKEVEFFTWHLPPDIWRKKGGQSSFKMTREDAARRYPGAEPILSSREVRKTGGEEITADAPYARQRPYYGEGK